MITDNLSSHNSESTREWLADQPRIKHTFIPVGACWLSMQEPWWRIFRREALAGQTFADATEPPPRSTPAHDPGSGTPRTETEKAAPPFCLPPNQFWE
ncbi:transposase [Nocardia sp. SC052]|uniref:transposase n=1 Tax=Nocardia sichangensis TaxID=3385975 RepID=UPI0039A0AD70